MPDIFDYIIVGAGSTGSVLASRLSERASTNVLLLEAGFDTAPGEEPPDVADSYPRSYYNPKNMWPGLKAHWRRKENSSPTAFPQGRLMGGSSSIMGMIALRGMPADYDGWERAGAAGWAWQDVLPYFRKLETDLDFRNDVHGQNGPVPVRRTPREDWPPLSRAISEYANEKGHAFVADMNGDFRDGYGMLPMSNSPTRRASAAMCYLSPDVRMRPNLFIRTNATVTRLINEERSITGVEASINGEHQQFRARETILACGAIHSPFLLMRAGIGDADMLRGAGRPVLQHLPGVGRNLQNHALVFVAWHFRRDSRQPNTLRTHPTTCFRLSSHAEDSPETDLYINIQSKTSWNALGRHIGNLAPVLWQPFSRGHVSLASDGAEKSPLVEFNFLGDERDTKRLIEAFRIVIDILAYPQVKALMGKPFPVRFNDRVRRLNSLSKTNEIKARAIAAALDLVPGVADGILARLTGPAVDLFKLAASSDEEIAAFLHENIAGMFHAAGTCRMGGKDDPYTVVDEEGRVANVDGLRVVDASIMPTVPRGNTNIPTIMVAEKIADAIRS